MHNYLFLRHHCNRTNTHCMPLSSRLQYVKTKITSHYYMNYSYINEALYCKGTEFLTHSKPLSVCCCYYPCMQPFTGQFSFNRIPQMCRGRRDNVQPYIPPPLPRLVTKREVNPQRTSRNATALQRKPLPQALAA